MLAFQVNVRWSTSCLATASVLASDCHRSAPICASLALAWAMLRNAKTPPANANLRGAVRLGIRSGWDMGCSEVGLRCRPWAAVPVNDAEHHRYEEQRGHRGEDQAADHGAPQRRILLSALPQP